jgi:hypothetical protein
MDLKDIGWEAAKSITNKKKIYVNSSTFKLCCKINTRCLVTDSGNFIM